MARQRVREHLMWKAAKGSRRTLERRLAQKACTGEAHNTVEHWKEVGRYLALDALVWDCDK